MTSSRVESEQRVGTDRPAAPATTTATQRAYRVVPRLYLRSELVTIDRSGGGRALLESIEAPVIDMVFEYGGQRVSAQDPRPRLLEVGPSGVRTIERDLDRELRARCLLESFGAVDLECIPDYAVAPGSAATYLLRCEGDVHDYCGFSHWAVPQLRRLGWQVEVAVDYPYQIVEEAGEWYAEVEPEPSRPDWFGLQLGIDLDGRRVNLLPALIELLSTSRDGDSFAELARRKRCVAVPLDDGRYLPIPPNRLRPILRIVGELHEGQSEKDRLIFESPQCEALPRLGEAFEEHGFTLRWEGDPGPQEIAEGLSLPEVSVDAPRGLQATLRDYQQVGLNWLQHLRTRDVGGVLADDMGLGKTLQTIAHLALEKEAGRMERPSLIVAPTSLVGIWEREIQKFAPALKTCVLHGPARAERYGAIARSDVVITSYPLIVRDEERLRPLAWYFVILDEAQTIKNARAQTHRAVIGLAAEHRLCLTGTPIENHLGELWALFNFLNPGLLGDEISFARWYRQPIEQLGDEDRLATLRQRVGPYIMRRMKEEVAKELPPKTEILRPVELGPAQRELYESIRVSAHAKVRQVIAKKGLAASTVPILDALTKLRQVCCDPRLLSLRAARAVRNSAKTELLLDLVSGQRERGHRILIFSQFARMLSILAKELTARSISHLMLTGASTDRRHLVEAFEGGAADVFLISLKAGGTGLTLTRADTVIHFDPWWNPAAQDQATDRAYRIGQSSPVIAYNLFVQGSVEERMLGLQRRKRRLAQGLLSTGKASVALGEDDVEELFAPLS